MVQVKYFIFFWYAVGNILLYCESNQFKNQNLYGSMTNAYPKSSCIRINDIDLVIHCLQTCMANVGIYYMSSYNREQQACLCCVDFSGSEITDPSWNTYQMTFCYTGYEDDKEDKNCLKYVPEAVTFPEAEAYCQEKRGALFKMDSQQIFDILTDFIGPIGKMNNVQKWIQAKKNGGDWYFDDNTVMPSGVCPMDNTNDSGENRLRFRAKDVKCADYWGTKSYEFVCEYNNSIEY